MDEFAKALETINLQIIKYDISKQRPVSTNETTMNVEKFCKLLKDRLGDKLIEFPNVFKAICNVGLAEKMLREYAKENGLLRGNWTEIEVSEGMRQLTLNLNLAAKNKEEQFFMTRPDETISDIAGQQYLLVNNLAPKDAIADCRRVLPFYLPRYPRGAFKEPSLDEGELVYNTYTPPAWMDDELLESVPDKLPTLFEKLVNHLFPLQLEREYFFSWLYESLFNRAFVFLILCGAPGTGKNRLKLGLRALHGHVNTVDGKKSTLVERFNSQLAEATLAWFDELHYDSEMENVMKELQNDSISIERKGVDATKGTRIHASIVISNNKPRDNYIAMDARKFVPLVINEQRLETSMTPEEIAILTNKVENQTSKDFDPKFIAQIAKWIKKNGRSKKWPNLEYRGPMFWSLAHTSMTRWQKKVISTLKDPSTKSEKWGYDSQNNKFLWSKMEDRLTRKGERSMQFPDYTSVKAFLESFRDGLGTKNFKTILIRDDILNDFWIVPLTKKIEIVTGGPVFEQEGGKENAKKEIRPKKSRYEGL